MKVLVVDDHALVRDGLRALLATQQEVDIIEARDGRAAVEMAEAHQPDTVVMDLSMPELNGFDATRQIVRKNPETKVVALSARSDSHTVREALAAGASAFVPKDAAFEELSAALEAGDAGKSYLSPKVAGRVIRAAIASEGIHFVFGLQPKRMPLSMREREVLQLTAEGYVMKEIAAQLKVSVKTVETHRRQLMTKLNIFSVAELTKFAIREGLTSV